MGLSINSPSAFVQQISGRSRRSRVLMARAADSSRRVPIAVTSGIGVVLLARKRAAFASLRAVETFISMLQSELTEGYEGSARPLITRMANVRLKDGWPAMTSTGSRCCLA